MLFVAKEAFMEKEVLLAATDYLGKEFPDTSAPAYLLLKFDGNDKKEIEPLHGLKILNAQVVNGNFSINFFN